MAVKEKKVPKLKDLIPDDRNANKHSEAGMELLKKGLKENGAGRSILISSDNKIIAGNGVTEGAEAVGLSEVQIVDSDGTKVIAVRRTDIKSGTREFYNMALSDNLIAKENIVMDAEVVDAICEEYEIEEWKGNENNVDYSEKNKEIDIDGMDGSMVIKLNYSEDEYNIVKGQLLRIADTPEQAVWKLLGNE